MQPIPHFDRETAINVMGSLTPWLEDAGREIGVKFLFGPPTLKGHGLIEFGVQVCLISGEVVMTPERVAFLKLAHNYGLSPDEIDATFKLADASPTYKIIGLDPKKKKYPILVIDVETGEREGCVAAEVRKALGPLVKRADDCARPHPYPYCPCKLCEKAAAGCFIFVGQQTWARGVTIEAARKEWKKQRAHGAQFGKINQALVVYHCEDGLASVSEDGSIVRRAKTKVEKLDDVKA